MRRTIVLFSMLAALSGPFAAALPAQAATAATAGAVAQADAYGGTWQGNAALDWAEANAAGCWYVYGGTGPCSAGYDCSGLVSTAYFQATGIWIGRDTSEQLATDGEGHFREIPVADARRGDILFYGTGHEELDTLWPDTSFGAHDTGTQVGWIQWGGDWVPTMAFEVS